MGFLRRLLGSSEPPDQSGSTTETGRPDWMTDGMTVTFFEGDEMLEVKGESFYQDGLRQVLDMYGREVPAVLAPEPHNEYDSNAVAVWVSGAKVGHLSREDAEVYQQAVIRLMEEEGQPIALGGRIVGGEPGKPSLGIWLLHDPEDFGVRSGRAGRHAQATNREHGGVLTGSAAGESAWMERLPSDRLAAIKHLRKLLATEADPVERHFMYLELEKLLYKSRDVFESALAEFEQTCRDHDAEMDDIVPMLVDALGGVPALPTYKQVAVMKQKQQNFEAALWWADRGLALYGNDGLREDHVEDLRNRAARYSLKLRGS